MSKWTQASKYHITNGTLTIAKVIVAGKPIYELWNGKEFVARGELEAMKAIEIKPIRSLSEIIKQINKK